MSPQRWPGQGALRAKYYRAAIGENATVSSPGQGVFTRPREVPFRATLVYLGDWWSPRQGAPFPVKPHPWDNALLRLQDAGLI